MQAPPSSLIHRSLYPVSCIIGVGMVGMVTGCSGVGMVLSVLPPVQPAPIRSRSRFPSTHSLPYHLTPSIHYPALRRSVVVTVLAERALRASFRLTTTVYSKSTVLEMPDEGSTIGSPCSRVNTSSVHTDRTDHHRNLTLLEVVVVAHTAHGY